jgi:phage terminase large subunit-like protein
VRRAFLKSLSKTEALRLAHDWQFWARDKQLSPEWDWFVWLILAGRGFGKTRTGAEMVRKWVQKYPLVNLIGATADDARDIMIQGESGILAVCPPGERPIYKKNERALVWPNGAKSLIFTAAEPDRLRGKQHMKLWADELCSWRYAEAWEQAMLGLRLGDSPQAIVTTTPRPTPLIKALAGDNRNAVTTGTTYENRGNLAPGFFEYVITKYENTRLGRQELNAEILEDNPGALWKRSQIEALRVTSAPALRRIVVAIDPAATSGGDENGIVVAGIAADGQGYVLDDLTLKGSPHAWATVAVNAYHAQEADRLLGEANNGGEMVEHTVRTVDPNVSYNAVHASRGKITRAEPIAALYEQGKVHHVGMFAELEDQMCDWAPNSGQASPDRMDALVWALTELMLGPQGDLVASVSAGHIDW